MPSGAGSTDAVALDALLVRVAAGDRVARRSVYVRQPTGPVFFFGRFAAAGNT